MVPRKETQETELHMLSEKVSFSESSFSIAYIEQQKKGASQWSQVLFEERIETRKYIRIFFKGETSEFVKTFTNEILSEILAVNRVCA